MAQQPDQGRWKQALDSLLVMLAAIGGRAA